MKLIEKLKIQVNILSVTSLLLLGVFGFIIVNKSLYTHSHVLAFGKVVTHAHPFDKSDDEQGKSHRHTQPEMLILDQINELFFSILAVLIFGLAIPKVRIKDTVYFTYTPIYIGRLTGRSPPF